MAFEVPEKGLHEGAAKAASVNFSDVVGSAHSLNVPGDSHAKGLPGASVASDGSITLVSGAVIPGGAHGTEIPQPPPPIAPLDKLPEPYKGPEIILPKGQMRVPGGGSV